jgi:hypothetical protein
MSTGHVKDGSVVHRRLERRLRMHAGDLKGGCGCMQET